MSKKVDAAFAEFEQAYDEAMSSAGPRDKLTQDDVTFWERQEVITTGKELLDTLSAKDRAEFMKKVEKLIIDNPSGYRELASGKVHHVQGRSFDILSALDSHNVSKGDGNN